MGRKTTITASAIAILVVAGFQSAVGVRSEPANALVGVCSATDTAIECWNPQGDPNPELAAKLVRYYSDPDEGRVIPFRYKAKNRLAVFETSVARTVSQEPWTAGAHTTTIEQSANRLLVACPLFADHGTRTASLRITLQSYVGEPIQLPARAKAKATLAGRPISIIRFGPIGRKFTAYWFPTRPKQGTAIDFCYEADAPSGASVFEAELLDAKGRVIKGVDVDGRPIEGPEPSFGEDGGKKFPVRVFVGCPFADMGDLVRLTATVDPRFVRQVRIRRLERRTFDSGEILLDPRR